MVANLRHHAADRVGGAMFDLVKMRREREAAVSRGAALGSDTARSRMAFLGRLRSAGLNFAIVSRRQRRFRLHGTVWFGAKHRT
jgi:hypothetical protein